MGMNFVSGFQAEGGIRGACWDVKEFGHWLFDKSWPKWSAPIKGEKLGIVTYQQYARKHFNKTFPMDFFDHYFTGNRIPTWEDNRRHEAGISLLDAGVAFGRKVLGFEPMNLVRKSEPRFEFNGDSLTQATWQGFKWFGPYDVT